LYEQNLPDKDLTVGPAAVDVVIPHDVADPQRTGNPDPADVNPAPLSSAPDDGVKSDNCAMQSANAIVVVRCHATVVVVVVLGNWDVSVSDCRGIILCDDNDDKDNGRRHRGGKEARAARGQAPPTRSRGRWDRAPPPCAAGRQSAATAVASQRGSLVALVLRWRLGAVVVVAAAASWQQRSGGSSSGSGGSSPTA
jgi:hypothetical protein